jgi:hypothetical protein
MAERLTPGGAADGVADEAADHDEHRRASGEPAGHDRVLTLIEGTLLAVVALLAAWSGYAAAKWSTESRLASSAAATARTEANRAATLDAASLEFDSATFNAWFTAYVVGNETAMDVATRRFRPPFRVAFEAWLATDPFNNANAPPGPTYMPQYQRPDQQRAATLDAQADATAARAADAADKADQYIRITVILATVLFLIGISGHFRVRAARYGLVSVGIAILIVSVALLVTTPRPPL